MNEALYRLLKQARFSNSLAQDDAGAMIYRFNFQENVYPYLKRGSVTSFDCSHDSASDVNLIGSWPSKAYVNDRIRDLGVMLNIAAE